MSESDVVLCFAFGVPSSTEPNRYLASHAGGWASVNRLPIVTQPDIAIITPGVVVVMINPRPGRYLKSIDIALRFRTIARERGWRSVSLFAAPPHVWRCARDLRKLGFVVNHIHRPPRSTRWYDSRSTQIWTRWPFAWWIREVLLCCLPWFLYRRLSKE
jgi:hypothetical protein